MKPPSHWLLDFVSSGGCMFQISILASTQILQINFSVWGSCHVFCVFQRNLSNFLILLFVLIWWFCQARYCKNFGLKSPACVKEKTNMMYGALYHLLLRAYLIFVISFTHAGFFNPKYLHQKTTKNTKTTKQNTPQKIEIFICLCSIWKSWHLKDKYEVCKAPTSTCTRKTGQITMFWSCLKIVLEEKHIL